MVGDTLPKNFTTPPPLFLKISHAAKGGAFCFLIGFLIGKNTSRFPRPSENFGPSGNRFLMEPEFLPTPPLLYSRDAPHPLS
jgi:hypothetical protein